MKVLDFSHGSGNLWLSLRLGVPVKLLVGSPAPNAKDLTRLDDSLSQFDEQASSRITVGSQNSVTPGKTNGLLEYADSQGWRNPRNGLHVAALYAYVEVIENKPYLAIRSEDQSLSLVLPRMAVSLDSENYTGETK